MRAILLAGGRGTRLEPYTTVLPKPLMPMGDFAVVEILIRQLTAHGVRQITISVGYLAEMVQAYCRDGSQWGVQIDYSREREPLGTAGPLSLLPPGQQPLLVVNGDLLTDLNFSAFMSHHLASDNSATVGVCERSERQDFGIVKLSETDTVTDYVEKPEYKFHVSMGAYVLNAAAVSAIPHEQPFGLPDLIKTLLASGKSVGAFRHSGYWLDIGRVDDYRRALDDFPVLKSALLPDSAGQVKP